MNSIWILKHQASFVTPCSTRVCSTHTRNKERMQLQNLSTTGVSIIIYLHILQTSQLNSPLFAMSWWYREVISLSFSIKFLQLDQSCLELWPWRHEEVSIVADVPQSIQCYFSHVDVSSLCRRCECVCFGVLDRFSLAWAFATKNFMSALIEGIRHSEVRG